ncbi:MAG: hypothetical protein P4M13_03245 [Alphaproteobacteria bacterium]|nr:hypothetical protein [Alphaproteobacteria bacterium]
MKVKNRLNSKRQNVTYLAGQLGYLFLARSLINNKGKTANG